MALDITVYSDYICPFCYVGMGTLQQLQDKYELNITWKGMEIHPETPEGGMLLTDFFKDANVPDMLDGLRTRAQEVGLKLGDLQVLANSHDALEVAELAREQGVLDEYHEAMMRAYFQDTRNIGDMKVIMDVAKEAGLNPVAVEEVIASSAYEEVLKQDLAEAQQWGVSGTPTFIIDGQYKIVGAQPVAVLDQFFEELTA